MGKIDEQNLYVIISAPGPGIESCQHEGSDLSAHSGMILVMGSSAANVMGGNSLSCYTSIWVREQLSLNHLREQKVPANLYYSGDLSYLYDPDEAKVSEWCTKYTDQLQSIDQKEGPLSIVVARSNNWGTGVTIQDGLLYIKVWQLFINIYQEGLDKLDLKRVVFATSDPDVDSAHYRQLEKDLNLHPSQIVVCETIEQLFGLFKAAHKFQMHLYTDRYHPGCLGHSLNLNVSVIMYPAEEMKMKGLLLT